MNGYDYMMIGFAVAGVIAWVVVKIEDRKWENISASRQGNNKRGGHEYLFSKVSK